MPTSRRHFIGATALGAALASEAVAESPQNVSANDRGSRDRQATLSGWDFRNRQFPGS